jgi:uncharacterized protein (DUF305 family)
MNKLSAQLAAMAVAVLLLTPAAHAQQTQAPPPGGTAMPMPCMTMPMQGGHGMPMPGAAAMSQNQQDMMRSMERMNRDMMGKPMTGNPDRDFVAMMAPHHQGAIDMARIFLREGKDPELRKMAEKIIADQEREIGEFKAWQAKHPS